MYTNYIITNFIYTPLNRNIYLIYGDQEMLLAMVSPANWRPYSGTPRGEHGAGGVGAGTVE